MHFILLGCDIIIQKVLSENNLDCICLVIKWHLKNNFVYGIFKNCLKNTFLEDKTLANSPSVKICILILSYFCCYCQDHLNYQRERGTQPQVHFQKKSFNQNPATVPLTNVIQIISFLTLSAHLSQLCVSCLCGGPSVHLSRLSTWCSRSVDCEIGPLPKHVASLSL